MRQSNFALLPLRTLVILLCALCCLSSPALARSWRIADFHSNITVSKDGSCIVSEHITLVFEGHFNGIYRYIPISERGPAGSNYQVFTKILSIKDDAGTPLRYKQKTENNNLALTIYVPAATDTTSTVVIEYLVRNGTRFFEDHDEFYYNVTGTEWPVPIDHASATVIFPPDVNNGLRAQAFTGAYGATLQEATSTVKGNTVEFETTNPLPMRAGLTIDIYIPKGMLEEPGLLTRISWFIASNPVVLVPLVTFVVMFLLWYWRGRDPDPGESVAPMYGPPPGMTAAEVGTLIDDSLVPRDISATLVELAVKGYIKIEDKTTPGLLHSHHDWQFHLTKPRTEWEKLAPHERAMLGKIFGASSESCYLSDLRNSFYTVLPMLKQDVMYLLKKRGFYQVDPEAAGGYSLLGAAIIVAVVLALVYLGGLQLFTSGLVAALSLVAAALIFIGFARVMTAKSLAGAQTVVHIKGFQEFMSRVEGDRLKTMPSDTFEKFLPYAMALGVETQWARAFASLGLDQAPPAWYVGPGWGPGWNPIFFTNSLHTMSNVAATTFVSQPRASSTGSGWGGGGFSSGGGFSGGGFGGGGGGAF